MPTPLDDLNERYKNMAGPWTPRASKAGGQLPARSGIWDTIRQEFSQMRTGTPAGQMNAGHMAPPSGSPANRAMNRAQQSGYASDIRQGLETMGQGFSQAAQELNRGPDTSTGPWIGGDRTRRLQMAGRPDLMAAHGRGTPTPSKAVATEGAGAGMEMPAPGTAMKEPASKSVSRETSNVNRAAYTPVAPARGMNVPASDKRYADPNSEAALRAKYMKMANLKPEQMRKHLASMGEGAPIEQIRGTKRTYWNPASRMEYESLPEALTGMEGRPTMKTELEGEQKALDRLMNYEKERYESDMAYRSIVNAAAIRASAVKDAAKIGAVGGGGRVKGLFDFETADDGQRYANDTSTGVSYPLYDDAPALALGVMKSYGFDDDGGIAKALTYYENLNQETRLSVLDRMSDEEKTVLMNVLKLERDQKRKK